MVDLVCKSIDAEGFLKSQYEKEQPIHSQEHRQQHALYLQSKRARKLEKRQRHDINQQSYLPSQQNSLYVSDQESACTQARSSQTESPQHCCKKRKAAANAPPSFSVTCYLLDIYNSFEWMEMVKTIEEDLDVLLRAR